MSFRVSIIDLGRRPGLSKKMEFAAPMGDRIGTDFLQVRGDEQVDVVVSLESVSDGVYVSGWAGADAVGQCVRCLEDLDEYLEATIDELVFYPDRQAALIEDGDEEMKDAPVVVDEEVDLEPLVRDALGLAIPFQPLCDPDCRGLCAGCGELWDDLPDDHTHEQADPRWAALADVYAKLSGEDGADGGAQEGKK